MLDFLIRCWLWYQSYFVPTGSFEPGSEKERQAHLILVFSLLVAFCGPTFGLFNTLMGASDRGLWIVGLSSGFIFSPFLLKWTRSTSLAGNVLLLFASTAAILVAWMGGGFQGSSMMLLTGAPLIAVLLVNLRSGIIWTVLVSCVFVFFFVENEFHLLPSIRLTGRQSKVDLCLTLIGFSLLLLALSAVYEHTKKRALAAAKDARKLAEEASLAKSLFLANMSHEIRTPLNAIIGYSEMMEEDAEGLEWNQGAEDAKRVKAAGKHLLQLVNGILDLSKIEAGKMKLHNESFLLSEFLQNLLQIMEPLFQKQGNKFELVIDEVFGEVRCDMGKLHQVLLNLLSNANKFTNNGSIWLRCFREQEEDGEILIFEVEDTGIGIREEDLVMLFDSFTQADSSTTRIYEGTGLGLSICQRFCELMGGLITVQSELGKGSLFRVFVELEPASEYSNRSAELRAHRRREARKQAVERTVLIIDDEPLCLDLMARSLSKRGYKVVKSSFGEEGLRIAEVIRPDAILLDIEMPGMGGWEVLAKLKSNAELKEIPVFMVSVDGDPLQSQKLGAMGCFNKPIEQPRLLKALNSSWN